MSTSPLHELAEQFGIATHFWDYKGRFVEVADDTIVAVLAALDVPASTPEEQHTSLQQLAEARWRRVVAPTHVFWQGDQVLVDVHVPAGLSISVRARLESGKTVTAWQVENAEPDRYVDGAMRGEATFSFGDQLPLGYHTIVVEGPEGVHHSQLIVAPRYVGLPRAMEGQRVWGYATQLYSVTSKRSWGMGDLVDLGSIASWAGAACGADYVLINPLHATKAATPVEPSPYLPSSRRFLSPLYIRPEAIPEFRGLPRQTRAELKMARRALKKTASDRIERDPSWTAKLAALETIFDVTRDPMRQIAFEAFCAREGEALTRFALWCVLCERFGNHWSSWPKEYQIVDSPEVAQFHAEHAKRVEFYQWLQWIADQQLAAAHCEAKQAGMLLGIINDLAVGVGADSAETWTMPELFAHDIRVGAPPDQYNQRGQEWGQPPWRPDKLEEQAFEPFRAMVSAAIRRVGGVRIDHVMGMFRLWWIPAGRKPSEGTYVRNNHEAMVGILALEAYRAQALVVGEDLGTVEPWVRDYLAQRGILGTSVAWFEYGSDGQPLDPQWWRRECMASVTTHDLPPTLGYLDKEHVRLRNDLGLLTEPLDAELAHANAEIEKFRAILVAKGLLDADNHDPLAMLEALHAYICCSPSGVLLVSLADAVGERLAQNMPGTVDEYPNWRVPLHDMHGHQVCVEDLLNSTLARRLAEIMNRRETFSE